jgi:uncharacterized membrane protein
MPTFRGSMLIVLIRAIAAVGLLLIGAYNFADGDYALGVVWTAIGLMFAVMAVRRFREIVAEERRSETGEQ